MSAPPRVSSSEISPVAALTSGGPARNTLERSSIITTWSLMPGTYAPPAVELPYTTAMVGMPALDRRVRSRKSPPPGMNTSFCVGRSAPPDSTRLITGRRFFMATSLSRRILRSVHGLEVPPLTVGSLAMSRHSTPETTPMPATTEAPVWKSEPHAASAHNSRNGDSGSRTMSMRSRAVNLPRSRWRATLRSLPPASAGARSSASWSSLPSIADLAARNSGASVSSVERRMVMRSTPGSFLPAS